MAGPLAALLASLAPDRRPLAPPRASLAPTRPHRLLPLATAATHAPPVPTRLDAQPIRLARLTRAASPGDPRSLDSRAFTLSRHWTGAITNAQQSTQPRLAMAADDSAPPRQSGGDFSPSSPSTRQADVEPQWTTSDKDGEGHTDDGAPAGHVWPEMSTTRQVLLVIALTLCMMLNVRSLSAPDSDCLY